ncbi:MAG: S9 family peptidase, partial [bacterium]|nr:S9 family peptidase [bacterium]
QLSRDGKYLAYLTGPPEKRTLKLIDLSVERSAPVPLTNHATSIEAWKWHPDNRRILFTAADADEAIHEKRKKKGFDVKVNALQRPARNLWAVFLETKKEQRLTAFRDLRISSLVACRDGRYWAFMTRPAARYSTSWDDEVHLLDLNAGATRRLTDNRQREGNLTFSPDGKWLAYTGPRDARQYGARRIFLAPTAGGEIRRLLTDWDYDGSVGFWSPDNRHILFTSTAGVNRQVYRVALGGATPEVLTTGDHILDLSYDIDSKTLLVRQSAPHQPTELFGVKPTQLNSPKQWVRLSRFSDQLAAFQLGAPETIRWKSTDGHQVEGLLTKPVDYREGTRYPLIVQIHGGPAGTSTNSFSTGIGYYPHVFAAKGYAVFQPNYRGSSGYGEDFRSRIAGDYFRQGFADVMSGVDYLIERGIADPDKLGHMGWSAGGHWSNWALTHTDRFKAIASGAGAVNWISMWAQSDMQINREFYFKGKPYENPEHYLEVSPITYIKNAKTPTLIFCGTDDPRVPNPQSRELYMSLQKLGVPVEYIEFPGQGHGISKPRYQLVKMEAELAWFAKWIHGANGWLDWAKLLATVPEE